MHIHMKGLELAAPDQSQLQIKVLAAEQMILTRRMKL